MSRRRIAREPSIRRALAGIAVVLFLAAVAAATPASAHALLVATSPGIGSQLETPPTRVTLTFDEAVVASSRSIVVTAGGERLDTGPATHPGGGGDVLSVSLRAGPADASYGVLWRVGSADGHAVDGSFSFGVGRPAGPAPSRGTVAGSRAVTGADDVAQAVAYLALAAAMGAALTVGALWPGATRLPRVRTLIGGGWGAAVLATVVLLALRGPVTAGTGLTTIVSADSLDTTIDTRSGRLLLARLIVLLLLLPALRRLLGRGRGSAVDVGLLGLLLVVSFPLGDHAGTGSHVVLAVTLGALHVTAAVVWLGGLSVLALTLLRPEADLLGTAAVAARADTAAVAARPGTAASGEAGIELTRWSRVASVCVAVIVGTGVLASVREVGSWAALVHTGYGATLLAKIAVLLVMLAVAELSRREVGRGATRMLRRTVGMETVLGVIVVGLTAALVGTQPARDAYAAPISLRVLLTDSQARPRATGVVQVDRTRLGSEQITLTLLAADGRPVRPGRTGQVQIDGVLSDANHEDDPLRFPFLSAGQGRAVADAELPEIGPWTLSLDVRGLPSGDLAGSAPYRVS